MPLTEANLRDVLRAARTGNRRAVADCLTRETFIQLAEESLAARATLERVERERDRSEADANLRFEQAMHNGAAAARLREALKGVRADNAWGAPVMISQRVKDLVLAALSAPAEESSGQAEPWSAIPPAKRFGRRLTADAVALLKAGSLLRFYSEDPWFEPGERSPTNGEIVRFTGAVSNAFPRVGQHLEVATLDGAIYPGGGWVYRMFQFVGDAPASDSVGSANLTRDI